MTPGKATTNNVASSSRKPPACGVPTKAAAAPLMVREQLRRPPALSVLPPPLTPASHAKLPRHVLKTTCTDTMARMTSCRRPCVLPTDAPLAPGTLNQHKTLALRLEVLPQCPAVGPTAPGSPAQGPTPPPQRAAGLHEGRRREPIRGRPALCVLHALLTPISWPMTKEPCGRA